MRIKRKAYISLEVVFLLTIMVISGMYVTVKLFNKGHNVSGQEAEAFSKVNHTVNNAINVGSSGGGGGGGGGGSTPSEPTGVIDTIYWGIDASGKLIISDVQVAGAVESGSFGGNVEFIESAPPWYQFADSITSIKVEKINRMVAPASTAMWFAGLVNVTNIVASNLDTSNVTNMYGMFGDCGLRATTFTIKGLETWDTSNVTDMGFMFVEAGNAATTWNVGNISNWNTSNVTDMSGMFNFAGVNAITELDLSGWDASNVTNMSGMFNNIESLLTIKTPKNIQTDVTINMITSTTFHDLTDNNKSYAAGTFPVGNGDISHTLESSRNPYASKIKSVKKIYEVGEASLTADDIITVNGIDCYVLRVNASKTKAELITKDMYNVRFDDGGHTSEEVEEHVSTVEGYTDKTYDYKYSTLRTWMNDFYLNKLGSNPYILPTTVTYYMDDSHSYGEGLRDCTKETIENEYVYALNANDAQIYASKFKWNYVYGQKNDDGSSSSDYSYAFWTTAAFRDGLTGTLSNWVVYYNGAFAFNSDSATNGARPVFWISLE